MSESTSQQNKNEKLRGGELVPGTVLDDRLEIVRRLSRGVKESVYLCKQLVPPHQTVVLKLLPRGRSGEDFETTYARFQREIVALYSISHPHVVNVFEAINDGEVFGYTMEYVDGGNLDRLLEEGGDLSFGRMVEILNQVCDALAAIHEAGIIHRSLKPKNILFDKDGMVKLADFAVAKVEGQRNLTSHGTVIGTMEYVSPEYVTRGVLDKRLDIYSLGVIAYEMITGTTPFQSEDFIETLSKRASMDPEPPHRLNPGCPADLSRVVMCALHRDPEGRYQSALEMLEDLESISIIPRAGAVGEIKPEYGGQAAEETEQPLRAEWVAPAIDNFAGPSEQEPFDLGYEHEPYDGEEEGDGLFGAGWGEASSPRRGVVGELLYWLAYAGVAGGVGFGIGYVALLAWWKMA